MVDGGDARFLEVTEFSGRETTLFLRTKADLHSVIAVSLKGLNLSNRTRPSLNDRNRDEVILPVVYLGHSDFFTE
jgi:hypothetical protein